MIEYVEFGVLSFVTIVTLGLMLFMVLDSKNDIAKIDALNSKYKNNGFSSEKRGNCIRFNKKGKFDTKKEEI